MEHYINKWRLFFEQLSINQYHIIFFYTVSFLCFFIINAYPSIIYKFISIPAAAKTCFTYIFIKADVHLFYKEKSFGEFKVLGFSSGYYFVWQVLQFLVARAKKNTTKGL